jgi:hypothetical protein
VSTTALDPESVVVLLPELPDWRRHFWRYAVPGALFPPFSETPPTTAFIGSYASCGCNRDDWAHAYQNVYDRLLSGEVSTIYVVEWSPSREAFVTRALHAADFLARGYSRPDGPLLRS